MFLTKQSIIILLFDHNDFQKEIIIQKMKLLKNASKESSILLVGINGDNCNEEQLQKNLQELNESLPKYKYSNLQQIQTICLKSGRGIKELKENLLIELEKLSFTYQIIKNKNWINFTYLIKDLIKNNKATLSWEEFKSWSNLCDIKEIEIPKLIDFLQISGYLYSIKLFNENKIQFILLRPQWIINLCKLINETKTKNGITSIKKIQIQFDNIIDSKKEKSLFQLLLDFLKKTKILYLFNKNEKNSILIPNNITNTRPTGLIIKYFPNEMLSSHGVICRILKFSYIPLNGLLFHFLIILLQNNQLQSIEYWKNGILICFQSDIIYCMEQDNKENEIQIYMSFPNLQNDNALIIWENLLEGFKNITENDYPSLLYSMEELIPCSHCQNKKKFWRKGFLFTLKECQQALLKNINYVYCQHIESVTRGVNIAQLVPELDISNLPHIELNSSSDDLNSLQLNELIGEGSYGKIIKGIFCGKNVAVKQMKCNPDDILSILTSEINEFLCEVKIMNQLNHPNIVKFYGFSLQPLQMIIQFLNGGDLFQFLHPINPLSGEYTNLHASAFPWNQRFTIAFSIAKGLHYLQTLNPPVIHRDLRSPNIFVS